MTDFQSFQLPSAIVDAIAKLNYTAPTPIQAQAIPLILAGKDILASSKTGSGKTAAFMIPLITKLMAAENDTALILTPTRELATQVMEVARSLLTPGCRIRTALLIGGEPIGKQFGQLRSDPRLVIGTPGRVNDHLKRRTLKLQNSRTLVLDEIDRMLDMGFGIQIAAIAAFLPKEDRQTLMFSATISKQIESIAQRYLTKPEHIKITSEAMAPTNITLENVHVTEENKYEIFTKELDKREGSILVFIKTKYCAQRMSVKLTKDHHQASAIHGDLKQTQRDRVMQAFRNKQSRIMVATDIASRGLDVSHIEHVINYDPPQMAEDYVHRIGRTARAGRAGSALNLISQKDNKKWQEISRMLKAGGDQSCAALDTPGSSRGAPSRFGKRSGGSSRFGSKPQGFGDSDRGFRPRPSNTGSARFGSSRPTEFGDSRPPRFGDNRPSGFGGDRSSGFGGDRSSRPEGDRPARFGGDSRPGGFGNSRPSGFGGNRFSKPTGDRPARFGGDSRPGGFGHSRPSRPEGDRPARFGGGDSRPGGFGNSRPSGFGGNRPSRPEGDRPARFGGDSRPGGFGNSRPSGFAGNRSSRPEGDRPARFGGDSRPAKFGDSRPARFGDNRPSKFGDSRPSRPEGDRLARFGDNKPTKIWRSQTN